MSASWVLESVLTISRELRCFDQRQHLPPQGILPPRIAIELEDTDLGRVAFRSLAVRWGEAALRRVRLANPKPARSARPRARCAAGRVFYLTDPYRIVDRRQPSSLPKARIRPWATSSRAGPRSRRSENRVRQTTSYQLVESHLALDIGGARRPIGSSSDHAARPRDAHPCVRRRSVARGTVRAREHHGGRRVRLHPSSTRAPSRYAGAA